MPCMVLLQHAGPAAALVADDLVALDADERRDVAELAHPFGRLVGDELAVGEDLEVAIGMLGEHVEQLRVHERLAADDAEEDVAHLLGFARSACATPRAVMVSCLAATSTQQPWQRRLQLLMIET